MAKKVAPLPGRFFCVSFFVDESHHSSYSVTRAIEFEWGTIHGRLAPATQYLVIGQRKNGKPHASEKQAAELNKRGATIKVINEAKCAALLAPSGSLFANWVRLGKDGEEHADHVLRAIRPPGGEDHTLAGVDLSGANLGRLGGGLNLPKIILKNARLKSLYGGDITAADCRKMSADQISVDDAQRVSFAEARIGEIHLVNFTDADFTNAQILEFQANNQRGDRANLTEATIGKPQFYEAKLRQAKFARARLEGADFRVADLTGTSFAGANLQSARFEHATLKNVNFSGADLRGARFCLADLSGARLDGANFDRALVAGCNLRGATVAKAQRLVVREPQGKFGPFAQELETLAKKSKGIAATFTLETPLGNAAVSFESYGDALRWTSSEGADCAQNALGFRKMFRQFAEGWWPHTTGVKKLWTTGVKCPLKGKKLTELVEAALAEVFGLAYAGLPAPASPPARGGESIPSQAAPKKRTKASRTGR